MAGKEAKRVRKEIRKAMAEYVSQEALVEVEKIDVGENDIVVLRFKPDQFMHPEVIKQSIRTVGDALGHERNVVALIGDEVGLESWEPNRIRALRDLCEQALGPTRKEQIDEIIEPLKDLQEQVDRANSEGAQEQEPV